jgi:hypothetical protein
MLSSLNVKTEEMKSMAEKIMLNPLLQSNGMLFLFYEIKEKTAM